MRLVSFSRNNDEWRIGALRNDTDIIDLTAAGLPSDMLALVELGSVGLDRAHRFFEAVGLCGLRRC